MFITSKVFEPEPRNLKRAILKTLSRSMQKIELLTDLGKFLSLSLHDINEESNKQAYLLITRTYGSADYKGSCPSSHTGNIYDHMPLNAMPFYVVCIDQTL